MKKIIFISCLIFSCASVYAQEKASQINDEKNENLIEAPFGLKWGITVVEAEAMNLKLSKIDIQADGKLYSASNLPKSLMDSDRVYLNFGYNNRLWLIVAVSKDFENDPYGSQVRARYNELSRMLEVKYGKPNVAHSLDDRLYKQADEFLAGIKNGRSNYFSVFNKHGVSIQLRILANSYSSGYYNLRYENDELAKEFRKTKKQNEHDAL